MKRKILFIPLCFLLFAGCTTFDQIESDPAFDEIQSGLTLNTENRLELLNGTYRVGPPDELQVSVQDNPEVGNSAIIAPDGNFFMPLLGNIYVEGLTLLEIRKKVHNQLGRFLKDLPEESVSVQVVGYNSKKVFVYSYGIGSVQALPFTGDFTVLDAIAQSGALTRRDNFKKIKVVRGTKDPDKKPQRLVLNLNHIIKGGKAEKNIVLRPNDVVYIPPTFLGFIGYKMKDFLFTTQPAQQLGTFYGSTQTTALGFNTNRGGYGGQGSSGNY